jgi:hypothetical protein
MTTESPVSHAVGAAPATAILPRQPGGPTLPAVIAERKRGHCRILPYDTQSG